MPYRLIITRPDGSQSQSSAEPLASRTAAGLDAMRVLGGAQPAVTIAQGKLLGREVRDAAIGVTVTHEPTGYRFRTEEF